MSSLESEKKFNTLAERLRALREHRKMSQQEVAAKVNVTQNAISYIEQKCTSSRLVIPLSKVLNCDPVWLSTGNGFSPFSTTLQYLGNCKKIPLIKWEEIKNYI